MSLPAQIKTIYNTFNQSQGISFTVYPRTAAGVGAGSGKQWTYSAWVEIIAATVVTADSWLVGAFFYDLTLTADDSYLAQVGTGAGAAEVGFAEFVFSLESAAATTATISNAMYVPVPRRVAASTRFAYRLTGAANANNSAVCKIILATGL